MNALILLLYLSTTIIIISEFINGTKWEKERGRKINVPEIIEQEIWKARQERLHKFVRNEWPMTEWTRLWPVKDREVPLGEEKGIVGKRKFPMSAIRGYYGPRNLDCQWEWPENGCGEGIHRVTAQVFATKWLLTLYTSSVPIALSLYPQIVELAVAATWCNAVQVKKAQQTPV